MEEEKRGFEMGFTARKTRRCNDNDKSIEKRTKKIRRQRRREAKETTRKGSFEEDKATRQRKMRQRER